MNTPLTTDLLRKMMADLSKDPLLEKGIGKDWVCVINPALVSTLKEAAKKYLPEHQMFHFNELNALMGRRVFIINDASLNIEYMDEFTMRVKYQEHFARENQAAFDRIVDKRLRFLYQRREAARKAYFDPDWDDPKEWIRTRKEFETAIHAYVESSKRYGREAPSVRERRNRY